MPKKPSRFQRIRQIAQALLDERTLAAKSGASRLDRFAHFWVLVWLSFSRNRCPIHASGLAYATLLALIPMLAVVVSITSSFLKSEGEERIDQFVGKLVGSLTPPAMINGTNGPAGSPNDGSEESNEKATNQSLGAATPTETNSPARATAHRASATTNENAISSLVQDEKAVAARKEVVQKIHQFIRNTRSGTLGVTGTVILIFVAISMLTRIEMTFNDIWGVTRGRSWFMRIVLYWGVLSLAPLLLTVALGLATGPRFATTKKLIAALPFGGTIAFEILSVAVLCLSFAVFYRLMPNTKVNWKAALAGGLVAVVLLQLNNMLSGLYVSRVVSNSKIYGSLGLVPVFMVGLYLAWLILLFGAQVAYAYQNRGSYLDEQGVEHINQRGREFVALRLMTFIGQRFEQGQPAPSIVELAKELGVPIRLVRQVAETLVAARLAVEATAPDPAYLPARPLESITCHDILLAMRATHGRELATRDEPTRAEVLGEFQRIEAAERRAAAAVSMLDLVNRSQAQAGGPQLSAVANQAEPERT
jgi:membrane protein